MQSARVISPTKMLFAVFVTLLLAATLAAQPPGAKTKFKVLHTFHGPDGANPVGQLVRDKVGNFYGVTSNGGKGKCGSGCGTSFKMDKSGKEVWLHSFKGAPDASHPDAGLLRDAAGNLYGTTTYGGYTTCNSFGCGTVFKLDKTGKETWLYKFGGYPDSELPEALLVEDRLGNVYGTTYLGGTSDLGTVFEMDAAGKEALLYSFAGPPDGGGDGAFSYDGMIRDKVGNLYGVTFDGGAYGAGAVYKLDTDHEEILLYSFAGGAAGANPDSVLLFDPQGNLYGTTENGGNSECGGTGCGIIYELSPQSGGTWVETTLYTFCSLSNCTDGETPGGGPLIRDVGGNLYGSTIIGGSYRNCNGDSCGVVFKLDPTGKETVLHSFTNGADGAYPWLDTMDASGNLYGATGQGGDLNCDPNKGHGCGTLFKITP